MPCNTQRAVKSKASSFYLLGLHFEWKNKLILFSWNISSAHPTILRLWRAFICYHWNISSVWKKIKRHQQESRDIFQGTNTNQSQERGVKKPSLTWVILGGLTRGWQWRRGSVQCAGNSGAGWEPGSAPSRCGGTRKADSAWGWKVWRQEMETDRWIQVGWSHSLRILL